VTGGVSPARSRAVEVLRDVLGGGARAAPLVGRRSEGLAPEDQTLLRELVLGVLRHKAGLDAEIASVSQIPLARFAPGLLEILELALYQIRHLDRVPAYAAVDQAVRQARVLGGAGAARLVNALLRTLQRRGNAPAGTGETTDQLARDFSHPAFLVGRWRKRFGDDAARRVLAADNRPSTLDLIANPGRTTRDALLQALAQEGIDAAASALAPHAVTVRSGNPIRSPLFAAGLFSIQDLGSQALPLLLPRGDLLVDLAAAPGGKTFAALFSGHAQRVACLDRSPVRLRLLVENVARLGAGGAYPAAGDFLAPPLPAGRFDRVLLDAPCSGTGTLRKNPEIRYRVTPEAIERLAAMQENAAAAAANLLAPGGFLLYATCSLEREENERVIERVLAGDPRLELATIDAPDALRPFVAGHLFRMLPDDASDGFTAHLLRRKA